MKVVYATTVQQKHYRNTVSGRKLHLSESTTRGDETLCGALVDMECRDKHELNTRKRCQNCVQLNNGTHPSQVSKARKEARQSLPDKLPYDPNKYTVTINTDASLSGDCSIAAGAWWIKSEHFDLAVKGSSLLPPAANSSIAELLTFEKAIDVVNAAVGDFPRDRVRIYINIDSVWVINALRGLTKKSAHRKIAQAVQDKIKGYELDIRHVKAHTNDLSTKRSWVNDWCDHQARQLVREEIKNRRKAHGS